MPSREFLLPKNLKKSKKLWKFGFFHLWPLFGLQKIFWPFFNFHGLQTSWIFKIIQIWIILKQFCHWNNFCLKIGKPDQCVLTRLPTPPYSRIVCILRSASTTELAAKLPRLHVRDVNRFISYLELTYGIEKNKSWKEIFEFWTWIGLKVHTQY